MRVLRDRRRSIQGFPPACQPARRQLAKLDLHWEGHMRYCSPPPGWQGSGAFREGIASMTGASVHAERGPVSGNGDGCRSHAIHYATRCILLAGAFGIAAPGCRFVADGQNATGVKLFQQGQYQVAMQHFQAALARDPKNADAYYNLASSLHKLGKARGDRAMLQQAETLYNQCLDHQPDHVECHRALAVLLVETGRSDKAFTLLKNWGIRKPDLADPRIELARLYDEFGDKDSARRQLEYAVALDPKNPRLLVALGHLREESGDYRQALLNYQRALQLNPHQPALAQRIASLRGTLGIQGPLVPGNRMARPTWSPPRY